MLGIHVSEGKAEGWFGKGKKSVIASIVILAVLIVGIAFGIFAAVSARGETNISPPNAPVTPVVTISPTPTTTPTPTPTRTPTTTPTPTPTSEEVLSIPELVDRALANKYEVGQTLRVSGVITGGDYSMEYIGPPSSGYEIQLKYVLNKNNGLQGLHKGCKVVVEGKYVGYAHTVVILKNSVLVSKED